jgi:ring-1,2-phenylacetyl-CoA epoxidase subunit PaaD
VNGVVRTSAWDAVAAVPDPEIRAVTIEELGILRDVRSEGGRVVVTITPTYTGCPAMDVIRADIADALSAAGYPVAEVVTVLHPAWSTDAITAAGRAKLAAAGIAPPGRSRQAGGGGGPGPVPVALAVRCPLCGSPDTEEISRFGSTACKALWRCRACAEPFDRFKEI